MKKIIALVLALATLSLVFCSCGGSSIKGDWSYAVGGIEIYGFEFTDTTVEMRTAGVSAGEYEYTDNGDGTLTVDMGTETTWTYEISGGKLTITISEYGSPIVCEKK